MIIRQVLGVASLLEIFHSQAKLIILIEFSYCLEEVGATRSRTLVKSFIQALTQGGPSGTLKKISLMHFYAYRKVKKPICMLCIITSFVQECLVRSICKHMNLAAM